MMTFAPSVDADQLRLRREFQSLPGLSLTVPQTARLLDIREWRAEELLEALEAEGFLTHTPRGLYRRVAPQLA